ncbi:MAG: hypothetical protein HFH03_05995 [Dorea sp.]|jgi:F0F1-type ATP synthase assembly protein I|nr:hypothetical protein [Dorea sp.]
MFVKKQNKTEEDRERELAKARAKQRKKLIKTKYGQRQKKHAKKGIQSCLLAAVSVVLVVMMVMNSFKAKGDISILYGILGLLIPVIAWRGLVYAVRGFNEREKNYITCRIGAGCNGALILCMCAMFIRGLF